ncbi:zinc-finger protein-like protein [Leptotrombidium deliense]|uniref:Zinc-finger protein-like protein n=1 Tax=Leptotrombidium deliense TaxID=299467 RepID=A0A443SWE1_9ACAR|nr:zinc-finger protein-like protein [Leptotrombidium deliense]
MEETKPKQNKKASRGKKSFYDTCFEKRKSSGLFMLDKKTEDKIYQLKKRLKKSGIEGSEIKAQVNKIRRQEELRARRNMKKRCLLCRGHDHLLADCPQANKSEEIDETLAVCYRCGSTEHKLSNCTRSANKLNFARCFVCREIGHISRDCPKNTKGVYPKGGACKKCGSKDHLVKDCAEAEDAEDQNDFTLPTLSDGISADAEFDASNSSKKQKKAKVVSF